MVDWVICLVRQKFKPDIINNICHCHQIFISASLKSRVTVWKCAHFICNSNEHNGWFLLGTVKYWFMLYKSTWNIYPKLRVIYVEDVCIGADYLQWNTFVSICGNERSVLTAVSFNETKRDDRVPGSRVGQGRWDESECVTLTQQVFKLDRRFLNLKHLIVYTHYCLIQLQTSK